MTAPVRGLHLTHSLAAAAHSAQVQAVNSLGPALVDASSMATLRHCLVCRYLLVRRVSVQVQPCSGAVNATCVEALLPAGGTVSAVTC